MALAVSGCFWPVEEEDPLAYSLPTTFSSVPLAVGNQVYTVERGDVQRVLTFEGVVQAGTQRELYFEVDGPIAEVHVANGDSVEVGDLLIELETEEAELGLLEAQLRRELAALRLAESESSNSYALELAELNLQIAKLELQKLQWDPNTAREEIAVAERQVEIAQANVDKAKAGNSAAAGDSDTGDPAAGGNVSVARVELELADLALTRAERALARLQLRAPISGTIRIGQMRIGTPVKAYETVARLVDPESLVVESNLVSDDQALLAEGMPVEMEVAYLRGVTFPGVITRLPQPYGSGMTPLTQIQPDLSSSNLSLREGAAVTVRAVVGRAEDVLWLPNSAVQTVGGKSYVVVREGDVLADREVTVGLVGGERSEIVAGLSEGMQVIGR